ncbi:response regulator [Romeriopsis navalis]|uniref:response regulator n=1 Tax=Romeriopsis navalis TaxID=2992132 RepID=UPI0021F90A9D|nr:response regulator [Romeriopsis navalis]
MASNSKKHKILVVDDEPDNLDLLYRTFHREFKVLKADDAHQALDILANEGDINVIISDQRMPMMSGTEFLSLTAQKYPDIIRIILTGYTDVDDLVEAINTGQVFKYVTKPWDDDDLRQVVQQAVDLHKALKSRTQELRRNLRRESLLNTITQTIRSALSYEDSLKTIATAIGQAFEVDYCLLSTRQDPRFQGKAIVYHRTPQVDIREESLRADGTEQDSIMPHVVQVSASHSLAKTAFYVDQLAVIDDVADESGLIAQFPEAKAAYEELKLASSVLLPLVAQRQPIALLALHRTAESLVATGGKYVWDEEDLDLIRLVATQAGLALAQIYSYEQVRASAKREALINSITAAIRSSLEPQKIFAAITQQLGQALAVDWCALSLWTTTDRYVQCVGLYDANQGVIPMNQETGELDLPKSQVPIDGNAVLKEVKNTLQPVMLDDLTKHPSMNVAEFRPPARALMVAPLIADGQIIGSISLRQNHKARVWQASELHLVEVVAQQAAIAVQQSHLYQKTRQQAEQLLELDRQKTEFFQNISHEFRTPLTLMVGPLESVVNNHEDLPLSQVSIVLRNSRRLLRLVNQLLDLQRLSAGRMQPTFHPCDLVDFTSQIVETFRAYCEKKGIRLTADLSDLSACPPIYLDLEKFDKVLYNLLSNAMKFTPAGKSITVVLRPLGEQCLLQVVDTGIGIRDDQLPHLFERFRQAEGSENRGYEGTGIGLSLVKELVELHGGEITVESVYERGTTFSIWLPTGAEHLPPEQIAEDEAAIEIARATVELADLETELLDVEAVDAEAVEVLEPIDGVMANGSRVLVVDDNSDLRTYISGILRQQGYQVFTAKNGAEGFQIAFAKQPHLIVTDLMMPQVTGLEMIQMIRNDESLNGIPVILLTAKADENTQLEGMERGADAYLSKPFNDRMLLAEVRNLLSLKANEHKMADLNNYLTESVLGRFLPPALVERAAKGDLTLDLRPEPRMVTVLFSDIVGFTELSNTLRSRRMAEMLNQYLAAMTQAVFDNGGTVDKFMGDAIMALFGAPEDLTPNEQVRRSIATARQMYRVLDDLNAKWAEHGLPALKFRCGIHQGTAVVGMFGGAERSDYTAIGPCVNIASRLQTAADPERILVSAAVADYLDEDGIDKGEPLTLKGVDETVLTFWVPPEPIAFTTMV